MDLKNPCNNTFIAYEGPRLKWQRSIPSIAYISPYIYVMGGAINYNVEDPCHIAISTVERIDITDPGKHDFLGVMP